MFPKFSTIMRDARDSLQGVWIRTFFKEVLFGLLGETISIISIISSIISLFKVIFSDTGFITTKLITIAISLLIIIVSIFLYGLSAGMEIGLNRYYLELARHPNKEPSSDLFTYVRYFSNNMFLKMRREIFIELLYCLFIIPGVIATMKWSMSKYIMAENYKMTATDAMVESSDLTDGYKMKIFLFDLYLFPLILLGLITFGIGFIWIIPWIQSARAIFYDSLKNPKWEKDADMDQLHTLNRDKFSYGEFLEEYNEKVSKKQSQQMPKTQRPVSSIQKPTSNIQRQNQPPQNQTNPYQRTNQTTYKNPNYYDKNKKS